jgi:hypothetical protein
MFIPWEKNLKGDMRDMIAIFKHLNYLFYFICPEKQILMTYMGWGGRNLKKIYWFEEIIFIN